MDNNDNLGCSFAIIFVLLFVLILFAIPYSYSKKYNAPECMFAQDVITCVQIKRSK